MLVLRLRSPSGQFRVEIDEKESIKKLCEKVVKLVGGSTLSTLPNNGGNVVDLERIDGGKPVSTLCLRNGSMLYSNAVPPPAAKLPNSSITSVARSFIKQDPLDEFLLKQPGTIKRERNAQFCKHGDQGMCEYCMPLQPYDTGYLEENKIKHMSFHAYLRQLVEKAKIPSHTSPLFIAPLDIPDYSVVTPCPSGTHASYPLGICSKCQPSAITLQTQNFRMVDHVEFESPSIIENFLAYWRQSGTQRAGFLYGRYEAYEKVPLGVKAVVACIYEMGQTGAHDYIQIDMDADSKGVDAVASELGLVRLGIIYTDLLDDGSGSGGVVCKRHADSYFLSSSEILFSAYMQSKSPVKTVYSPSGEFGSRFVTLVVTGNNENQIDFYPYQVSNSAMSMTHAKIIEASTEAGLMRVCAPSPVKYIPDVFFKYKNEYNIMVQEAAKPTFPVEYLLITASHGFPSAPNPFFRPDAGEFIENREAFGTRSMVKLKQAMSTTPILSLLSNIHLLIFLGESGILDDQTMKLICRAVREKDESLLAVSLDDSDSWVTLKMILAETQEGLSSIRGASGPSDSVASGPWSCRHCTFNNDGGESCEICGLPRHG